jgi:hypothetical protein
VNSYLVLCVIAARKMPRAHNSRRCLAAGKPVIHARPSETNPVNSQIADKPAARFEISNGRFQNIDS